MNQKYSHIPDAPLSLKLLGLSQRIASFCTGAFECFQSAVFMGLIDDKVFRKWDTYPYHENPGSVDSLKDMERGFKDWEQKIVDDHASHHGLTLVIAAGGGREAVALKKRGSFVEGIEFDADLAASTNEVLETGQWQIPVTHQPHFEVPEPAEGYDTVFIGRLYLSYIYDRTVRIESLKKVRMAMKEDGILIFGYYMRPEDPKAGLARSFRLQAPIANLLRKIRGKNNQQRVEIGNHLDPYIPNFHQHFIEQEVTDELREAGFDMIEQGKTWFGWAAASPAKIPESLSETSKPDHGLAVSV